MYHSKEDEDKHAKIAVLDHIQAIMHKSAAGKLRPKAIEHTEVEIAKPEGAKDLKASEHAEHQLPGDALVKDKLSGMPSHDPSMHQDELSSGPSGDEGMESPAEEASESPEMEASEDEGVHQIMARRFGRKRK